MTRLISWLIAVSLVLLFAGPVSAGAGGTDCPAAHAAGATTAPAPGTTAAGTPATGDECTALTPAALRASLLYGGNHAEAPRRQEAARGAGGRSIPLAFVLSAAVPGLGQAYNRHWIKTAAAVALEAGIISAYAHYQQSGLDAEAAYKDFAHRHWSPPQYARYLNDFKDYLATNGFRQISAGDIIVPSDIDFKRPEAWTAQERGAARMFFDQIRAIESQAIHPETGASYSHKLPYFAEQQYYELIGKYFQFAPGWDDYPAWKDAEGFTEAIDPETAGPDGTKINVRGRMVQYAADHAESNDMLRLASRFTGLLVANHLLAAIDAAVFAKLHNDRIERSLQLTYDGLGVVRPVATLQLKL